MKNIQTLKKFDKELCLALIIFSFFLVFLASQSSVFATRKKIDTCPTTTPRAACSGPWAFEIKDKKKPNDKPEDKPDAKLKEENKKKLAAAITAYVASSPQSKFLEFKNKEGQADPGTAFIEAGEANKVSPLFMLAIASVKSELATSGKAALECGNPWGQAPTAGNPVCTSSDGNKWYEYNDKHEYNKEMLNEQAKRLWYTYVNDPKIRNVDDFIKKYNELNPIRDVGGSTQESAIDSAATKARYTAVLDFFLKDEELKDVIKCGGGGCDTIDYSNPPAPLSSVEMQLLKDNIEFYKQIASQADIPCEMLVAVAYRENTFNTGVSLLNGGAYGNDEDENSCAGNTTKESDYICGAQFLDGKVGGVLNADTKDQTLIKDAFWGWNGKWQDSADVSNYVANFWHGDGATPQFQIVGTLPDGSSVDQPDEQLGAFALYKWLIGEWPITVF